MQSPKYHVASVSLWKVRDEKRRQARDADKARIACLEKELREMREHVREWQSWYYHYHLWGYEVDATCDDENGQDERVAIVLDGLQMQSCGIDYSRWNRLEGLTSAEDVEEEEEETRRKQTHSHLELSSTTSIVRAGMSWISTKRELMEEEVRPSKARLMIPVAWTSNAQRRKRWRRRRRARLLVVEMNPATAELKTESYC